MLLGQDFGGVYLYLLFAVNVSLTQYSVCPKSKNQTIKGGFFRLFSTIIRKKRNIDKKEYLPAIKVGYSSRNIKARDFNINF
jgi:hypothetical protein